MHKDVAALPNPDPLPDDPILLKQMVAELLATLTQERGKMAQLQHRLELLLQRMYGPRAERINPNQLLLFANQLYAVDPAPVAPAIEPEPEPPTPGKKNRSHGRKELPADLPRIALVHDLTEAEKACPDCGQLRQQIGEEKTEQLDYVPASVLVIEHRRPKYACRHCEGQVAAAAKPPQPIPKGVPAPGLLAHVITSKYGDHLPLYRMERILSRFGIDLSRSTLCDWMRRSALLLKPLYECMVRFVLQSQVLHTDDTPVPVLDPDLDKTKTGRLWVYLGDAAHPYNVFAYTPNRKRDGPATFLANYQGYLQADAFGGYDGIYATQAVTEVGCNAHARRKFYEARDTDSARAHQALAYYRQLYDIERTATESAERDGTPLAAERLRRRQQQAVPLLADFHSWLSAEAAEILPKSAMQQAFGYALNHWDALTRYTSNGCLQIDNNWAEREMKRIAIGRKNWLFAGSDQGGETAAVLFSMVSSCQRHGIDPFAYLRSTLASLPGLPISQLETYLPDHWATAKATTEYPKT